MNNPPPDGRLAAGTPANLEGLAQATLDALGAHVAVLDGTGTIIAVNRAWRAFAEANPPVWSNVNEGANYLAVCDAARGAEAAEAAPVAAAIRDIIGGRRASFEIEYACHSGTTQRWFTCRITVCSGAGPRRVVVAHENITARRRAEAELSEREERLRFAMEGIEAGEWDLDLTDHSSHRSPMHDRIFGYAAPLADWTYERFLDHVVPEDRTEVDALFKQAMATRGNWNFECRIVRRDGERRWILVRGRHLLDASGQPQHMVGIVQDITARKQAEEALQGSQRLLRQVIDLVPHHIFAKDRDGRFLFINRTSAESIGLPPEQVIGRLELELRTDKEHAEKFLRDDREVIDRDVSKFVQEEEITDPAGRLRFLQTTKIPFTPPGGDARAVMGVAVDITERKQVEQDLRASELEFRAMFEMASIGMAQANPWTGQLLRVNQKLAAITGYSTDELIRMRVQDVTHPSDRDKDWALFQQVVRGEAPAYRVEKRYIRKDGSVAWVNVNMTIIRDAAGVPQRTLATIEDITERRQAEEQHARLALAVEQSAEAIVITDTGGTIVYVNPAFERISGFSAAEAVGRNPRILSSGTHPPEFFRAMWTTLTAGQTWSGHIVNRSKDGALFEEAAIISPVLDATGRIVNYVAVKRDITREAQLELQLRQAQKMDAVGRLAGGVAHDFNNLLMGIMGYTEMCQNMVEADHPIREWLDEVMLGARRSADLTRQLLAFASKQVIAPRILNLNEAVAGMLKMLRRLIGEDIDLAFHPGANLWPVLLDPSQVDQILANLCVNARDAIAGVGRITLRTGTVTVDGTFQSRHPEAVPGDYVSLAVGDTGCGMDAATLAQIFEPFFTTKALGKGTGLGLSTVYGIVKQNRGFIVVDCPQGQGTTFTIHLPRADAKDARDAGLDGAAAPPRGGETILLTEDEQAPREICRLFLESLGYHVLTAASPAEALQRVGTFTGAIDLLITDIVMPGMDGRQLAREIGAGKPGLKVLFMSGYTPDVIARRGVMEPNTAFLAKPFTRDELAAKVREVLDGPPAKPNG